MGALALLSILFFISKRWIGLAFSLFFLATSFAVAIITNNQLNVHDYFSSFESLPSEETHPSAAFHKQVLQAVEDLKSEVDTEKENLRQVIGQVSEIVNSIDIQKQKLQAFIEETRERFQTESNPPKTNPES